MRKRDFCYNPIPNPSRIVDRSSYNIALLTALIIANNSKPTPPTPPAPDGYVLYLFRQKIKLIGNIDGVNRMFVVPNGDKFINGTFHNNEFRIYITHNGRGLSEGIDYILSESGGVNTGFDTITMIGFTPLANRSVLEASYVIIA
jgi:hypothetical protein